MKRFLLAGTATLATFILSASAHAQMPVTDAAHVAVSTTSWAKQTADMVRQLTQLKAQYEMLVSTYRALSHTTDVFQIAGILGGNGVTRTYMPQAGQAMSLFSGSGTMYGAANSLMAGSRYLDMTGDSTPESEEMARRERATANFRAVGLAGMESAQESVSRLSGLLDWITGAEDVTAVSAANAAIASETQNMGRHQEQMAQTQVILLTENRVDQQRAEQMKFESTQALLDATRPLGGSLR